MAVSRNFERGVFIVLLIIVPLFCISFFGQNSERSIVLDSATTTTSSCESQQLSSSSSSSSSSLSSSSTSCQPQRVIVIDSSTSSFSSSKFSSLDSSLAIRHHKIAALHDPAGPIGHSRFLRPDLQDFRFSALLSSVDVPLSPHSRGENEWQQLGVFTSDGKPDQAYGPGVMINNKKKKVPCVPTEDRADEAVFGAAVMSRKKMVKSNPVPERCIERLEPLNPYVPLRSSGSRGALCAQNRRRFTRSEHKQHAAMIDHDETSSRIKKRENFLGSLCPELMPPPIPGIGKAGKKSKKSSSSSTINSPPRQPQSHQQNSSSSSSLSSSSSSPRRIFIDVGARHYLSSAKWFRDHYPEAHTFIIHAFDVSAKWAYSFQFDKFASFHTAAVWNESGYVSFILSQDTFGGFFHRNFFDAPLDLGRVLTVPAVALAEMLSFLVTEEDFVVLKMDVEGSEWNLLRHMAEHGSFDLVDEMFIECHHGEYVPSYPARYSLADCHRMFNSLRSHGIAAHEYY